MLKGPGRDGMTAYGRLAAELWRKISAGEWPAGTRLPTVVQLARQYGVAPVTVRGALGLLVAQGLVHSRQGRGTFVLERQEQAPAEPGAVLGDSYFESWIVGPQEAVKVLERQEGVALPPELADGAPAPGEFVHLRRLHLGGELPVCLVDFYIARDAYDSLPPGIDAGFKVGLLLMTKAEPRPARGRQITTVGLAGLEDAPLLQIPPGSPVVRVDRRFLDDAGRVLGAGVHRYPGSVFRQVIDQPIDEILAGIESWLPSSPGGDRPRSDNKNKTQSKGGTRHVGDTKEE
ncbi:transcriptional regulator, GntR family [Tistlia consotensis]|uniref:Transcriptional regulator, GntR family n=1 Tax=Tistlia consotensis USBA 355 TaxID=560819 RepID=A0A1Y6CEF3_9PROT|nr:GntR family transcriptional regulator [Tistlia consotensis]SMF57110.1 transcriptional regulator, GntR family [Tistlia consotensis USBA 355]SNR45376.1 transcriptional regulator, GntR family [Tistlia consotensis]